MDMKLLNQILNQLQSISPRKAAKLEKLVSRYQMEQDTTKQKQIGRKIKNMVYNLFTSLLSRKSRNDLYNTSMLVEEDSYSLEQQSHDDWYINYDGAVRVVYEDHKPKVTNFIPREYKKGFYLEIPKHASSTDALRELEFYNRYVDYLNRLSAHMDHKQEIISCGYELKNPNMDKAFPELLIDFLGFKRIQEPNKTKEMLQKVKS